MRCSRAWTTLMTSSGGSLAAARCARHPAPRSHHRPPGQRVHVEPKAFLGPRRPPALQNGQEQTMSRAPTGASRRHLRGEKAEDDEDDADDVRQAMKDLDRFELNHGVDHDDD